MTPYASSTPWHAWSSSPISLSSSTSLAPEASRPVAPALCLAGVRDSIAESLETAMQEHVLIQSRIRELVPIWNDLATSPQSFTLYRELLESGAEALRTVSDRHLAREEAIILPELRLALTASMKARILAEMHRRRRRSAPTIASLPPAVVASLLVLKRAAVS